MSGLSNDWRAGVASMGNEEKGELAIGNGSAFASIGPEALE